MDRNFVIYIRATSHNTIEEDFTILDRIAGLTEDEVKAVLISAKKQLHAEGYTIIHHCDSLGQFHASTFTHEINFTPICYHNNI